MPRPSDRLRPSLTPEWVEPAAIPEGTDLAALHPHPLVARILFARGITDPAAARAFSDTRPAAPPSPWNLPNMEEAAERVTQALDAQETVAIFGDYDADGITSAVLLTRALRHHLGPDRIVTLLPERDDGYGLSLRGVGDAARAGATLLIAVDCGSNDHAAIAAAQKAGMDVVVLDHHQIAGEPPEGAVVVSPQLGGDPSYRDLTGVGIAWLLVTAMAHNGVTIADPPAKTERGYLDLVAIGTVADVSPLLGINRSIVRDGLAVLRKTIRPGLRALVDAAGRTLPGLASEDISFAIAPRLNAAGRLGSPRLAYDLLMADDPASAQMLALELERVNRQRKALAATIEEQAVDRILARADWADWPVLIASGSDWPAGMVGTVAAKISEAAGRPAILFQACDDGVLKGSARSIPGVDITAHLSLLDHLLIRHGGHSGAAGLSLKQEHLDEFAEDLAMQVLAERPLIPAPSLLQIDADLAPGDLSQETVSALSAIEPCGRDNAIPNVRIRGGRMVEYATMGSANDHLKIRVLHGDRTIECVFWGAAHRSRELLKARTVDIVGTLGINTWRDRSRLQLDVKDFRAR